MQKRPVIKIDGRPYLFIQVPRRELYVCQTITQLLL